MRDKQRITALSAALSLGLVAVAQAEENAAFGIERWRWSQNADGILDVESGQVGQHKEWTLGTWVGYANDPLLAYTLVNNERERFGALMHHRVGGALVASVALWRRLELGLEVPFILYQFRSANLAAAATPLGSVNRVGLGDIRLRPKLQLLRQGRHGVDVGLLVGVSVPTGRGQNYFGDEGMTLVPELAVSRHWGRFRVATNLGYRARKNQQTVDLIVGDEVTGRLGLGYQFAQLPSGRWAELGWAATGAANASALSGSKFNQVPLETNIGVLVPVRQVDVLLAGGVGLHEGYGTPDWRALVGLRFHRVEVEGPRCKSGPEDLDGYQDHDGCADPDNDGDGVLDVVDKAPMDPEDKDGFEDADGAPEPDNDKDGLNDKDDTCPNEAEVVNGKDDADGCPDAADADGDGVSDAQDQCPAVAEDVDTVADEDGCPEDDDADGVADREDKCRAEPGPAANGGCPDADQDSDKVVDRLDNCPTESGSVANHGCQAPQLATLVDGKIEIIDMVYFKTNRDVIQTRSYKLLKNVADVIKAHPELPYITVEGHTDDRGDDAYNQDLSQRRAQAVVNFLIGEGIAASRLVAKGYGETKPVADNTTDRGRSTNRRVEFKISNVEVRQAGPSDTLDGTK